MKLSSPADMVKARSRDICRCISRLNHLIVLGNFFCLTRNEFHELVAEICVCIAPNLLSLNHRKKVAIGHQLAKHYCKLLWCSTEHRQMCSF